MMRTIVAAAMLALAAVAAVAKPVGREFPINTYTAGRQFGPAVAGLNDGDFVVTWTSSNQIGFQEDVYARRFKGPRHPLAAEFRVNTYKRETQVQPDVAKLKGGGFVTVYWSWNADDTPDFSNYAQRFDAAGSPVGNEFRVGTTAYREEPGRVAGLSNGGFVVTFIVNDLNGIRTGVYGRVFDASGVPAGAEFLVSSVRSWVRSDPVVAGLSTGGFVIAWTSFEQDGSGSGIYGRIFSNSGAAIAYEFRINTTIGENQIDGAVAALHDGRFAIVWSSNQGSESHVYGQMYDRRGGRVGKELQLSSRAPAYQYHPSVAGLDNGGFIVAWAEWSQKASDYNIEARRFNSGGEFVGAQFQVNTHVEGFQFAPAVAALGNRGYVVTWESLGQDLSGSGVYGQVYDLSR